MRSSVETAMQHNKKQFQNELPANRKGYKRRMGRLYTEN